MKDGHCIILCHIDLIQDSESPVSGALVNRPFPKLYLIAHKGICADQSAAVRIHMERYIVKRPSENPCQILGKYILSRGLVSAEKDILPLQNGCHCFL